MKKIKTYTVDSQGRTTGSPCVRVCKKNEDHGLCEGCFRSIEEIEQWSEYTDEQKQQIMVAIDIRKELLCEDTGI